MNSKFYEFYLLFNSDIVNFVLKTDGVGEGGMGVAVQKSLFCYFCFLASSQGWKDFPYLFFLFIYLFFLGEGSWSTLFF